MKQINHSSLLMAVILLWGCGGNEPSVTPSQTGPTSQPQVAKNQHGESADRTAEQPPKQSASPNGPSAPVTTITPADVNDEVDRGTGTQVKKPKKRKKKKRKRRRGKGKRRKGRGKRKKRNRKPQSRVAQAAKNRAALLQKKAQQELARKKKRGLPNVGAGNIRESDWQIGITNKVYWVPTSLTAAQKKFASGQLTVTTNSKRDARLMATNPLPAGDFVVELEFSCNYRPSVGLMATGKREEWVASQPPIRRNLRYRLQLLRTQGRYRVITHTGSNVSLREYRRIKSSSVVPFITLDPDLPLRLHRFQVVSVDAFKGFTRKIEQLQPWTAQLKIPPGFSARLVKSPSGMKMDNKGHVTWKPTRSHDGEQSLRVSLSSGNLRLFQDAKLLVTKAPPPRPNVDYGATVATSASRWEFAFSNRVRWVPSPIPSTAVKTEGTKMVVTGTRNGRLQYKVPTTTGDFLLHLRVTSKKHNYSVGIASSIQSDRWIGTEVKKSIYPTLISIQRQSGRYSVQVNGKRARTRDRRLAGDQPVVPFLTLGSGQVIEIESLNMAVSNVFAKAQPHVLNGKTWQATLHSTDPTAKFKLVNAPSGLKLTGKSLAWTPTAKQVGRHPVEVEVTLGAVRMKQKTTVEVVSAALAKLVGGDLRKLAKLRAGTRLPHNRNFMTFGLNNRTLLALAGDQFWRLDETGMVVLKQHKFRNEYREIYERRGYFVALSAASLDIIDKQTLRRRIGFTLNRSPIGQLAIHPTKPISYVTIPKRTKNRSEIISSKQVLEITETSGSIRVLRGVNGNMVRVHPNGKVLYTCVHDMYKNGVRIDRRFNILPKYAHVDVIFAYDISGASPKLISENRQPGANGRRLLVSPDGGVVGHVSGGGAPGYGYSIPLFDHRRVQQEVARFRVAAYPHDLAFHPSQNIVACTNGNKLWFYNRLTKQELKGCYDDKFYNVGGVSAIHFSPSGNQLVVAYRQGKRGPFVMQSVPLQLPKVSKVISRGGERPKGRGTRFAGKMRTWQDKAGLFKIQAKLLSLDKDTLILVNKSGQNIRLKLSDLSKSDQEYVKKSAR